MSLPLLIPDHLIETLCDCIDERSYWLWSDDAARDYGLENAEAARAKLDELWKVVTDGGYKDVSCES